MYLNKFDSIAIGLWVLFMGGLAACVGMCVAGLAYGRSHPFQATNEWVVLGGMTGCAVLLIYSVVTALIVRVNSCSLGRGLSLAARPLSPLFLVALFTILLYVSDEFNHWVISTSDAFWICLLPISIFVLWTILTIFCHLDNVESGSTIQGRSEWTKSLRGSFDDSLGLCLIQFLALRIPVLFLLTPHALFERGSDFGAYEQRARLGDQGLYPIIDYWVEYPPLFPWIASLARSISNALGGGYERFDVTLGACILLFDVGVLVLIYLIAMRIHSRSVAYQIATFYTLLFLPLYIARRHFEAIPMFFMLLGIYWAVSNRLRSAAAALGIGFTAKVFPAVLILVLLYQAGWRRASSVFTGFALPVLVVVLPFYFISREFLIASFRNMVERPAWESLWALIGGYSSYGWVHRYRLDPGTATEFLQGAVVPLEYMSLLTLGFLMALFMVFFVSRHSRSEQSIILISLTILSLFAIFLKGWSPQFAVWFVPLLLLAFPGSWGLCLSLLLTFISILEYPAYFVLWSEHDVALWIIVIARTVFFSMVAVVALMKLRSETNLERDVAYET
tara:strand:+ start:728 stop:2413 length:1686 start_codon:yes stop_codon:yes gene_type:complete